MNVPADWPLMVIAAGAAIFAIIAGHDLDTAIPAGVVAVVAAGLLLAGSMGRMAWHRPPYRPMAPPIAASSLRAAFRSGRAGRQTIVAQLDRLERMGPHPMLEVRTAVEEEWIHQLPRKEFRAYVRERLDTIEAADR